MEKSYRSLLMAQSCANLADVFFRITVITNLYFITHSVIATSIIPILIGISGFCSSFFLPVITRKLKLNQVLLFSQIIKSFALTVLFALLLISNNHALLATYILVTVISFMDGFEGPTSAAIIPRFATDLIKANSLLSVSSETVEIVGWGLGGILLTYLGTHLMLAFTVILFWLATLLFYFIPSVHRQTVENETTFETIFKGWKLIFTHQKLKLIFGINLFEILANSIWVSSILLVYITSVLKQGEAYWGYVNTLYSIGIIIGGWGIVRFSSHLNRNKPLWIVVSLVSTAITLSLSLMFVYPLLFLAASVFIGFFSQLKEIPESTIIQESVNEHVLVNVYATLEVVSTLVFSLSVFLMSSLTELIPVKNVFWITVGCILIEAILVFKVRKQLR